MKWIFLMAWRDSRRGRRRLLLFSASVVLGIAALVAIRSFGESLKQTIEVQAKSLLGADLVFGSRDEFPAEVNSTIDEIGGERAREVSLSSMAFFMRTQGTRLIQLRALDPGFPFYGSLETQPLEAAQTFRSERGALVEASLMSQFDAKIGDRIKLGQAEFPIVGILEKVPGDTVAFASIAPRIYIPFDELSRTGLLRDESLARFKTYVKVPADIDPDVVARKLERRFREHRVDVDSVNERKQDLGRSMGNLERFLSLGGLIALLLGGVGVASAVNVHAREKLASAATLRCLGLSSGRTLAIYLVQGLGLGLIGSFAGAALGLIVQSVLPAVVADFVPVPIEHKIVWSAVGEAMLAGFAICGTFAILPLLPLRHVPPLAAIRSTVDTTARVWDAWQIILFILLSVGVLLFSVSQAGNWRRGLGFFGGLAGAFTLLWLVSRLIIFTARRAVSPRWPYVWRQGMANLFRPNNRTTLLTLSIGLGAFLILTLFLVQGTLLTDLLPQGARDANAVLFDIQQDQREGVVKIMRDQGAPVLQEAPLVTMRLASVKGRTTADLMRDPQRTTPRWVLRREYRSSYRDRLENSETHVSGQWPAKPTADGVVPVSLEKGIAEDLKVAIGDEIEFDVQGVPIKARVAHLREVDWRRLQPNFFVLFPTGVLDDAPAFFIITTRVDGAEQSAKLQREIVQQFPNVSAIDMTLIMRTVEGVVEKISFVIRFMALFTVFTGLTVLAAAILTSRFQRVREAVLLRTLGASQKQVSQILLVEYFLLGFLASLTAAALSVGSSWALAKFLFETPYSIAFAPLLITVASVCAITMIMGYLGARGPLAKPPLEVLRAET